MRLLRRLVSRRPGLLAAVGLALLPFAVFSRALLPGKVLSPADMVFLSDPWKALAPGHHPANDLLGDVAFLFHPWLVYAGGEVRAGRFPLWNPHELAGAPFFANPQSALLFPLTGLAYVMPAPTAATLIAILKLVAAGLGMYCFLATLCTSRLALVVGAITFMFNGALIVWLQWTFGSAMVVLPFLMAMTERMRQQGGPGRIVGLAACVAIAVFAGYPQMAAYSGLAIAAWALCRARGAVGGARSFLGRFTGGVTLGVALGTVQWLPFLEYAHASSVQFVRAQTMPLSILPLRTAITFFMPYYFGDPGSTGYRGPVHFNELSTTVGLLPWLTLPTALLFHECRIATRFFAGQGLLAAATVYGTPLVGSIVPSLPLLSLAARQRILPLLVFSLCVLGALGLDVLVTRAPALRTPVKAAVVLTSALLAMLAFAFVALDFPRVAPPMKASVFWQCSEFTALLTLMTLFAIWIIDRQERRWVGSLILAGLQLGCLLPLTVTHLPVIDDRLFYPAAPPAIEYVRRQTASDHARASGVGGLNLAMLYGLREVTGYDGMTPRRVEEVVGPGTVGVFGNGPLQLSVAYASPLFHLLAIRHVIVPPGAPKPAPHLTLAYDGADARVFDNPRALPRVFVVKSVLTCLDEASGLRLMRAGQIDFTSEVLIDGCDGVAAVGPGGGVTQARIVDDAADRLIIHASIDTPAYLVVTDTWFPGWHVTVDGRANHILRANHAFRGVWLATGEHVVEFWYRPRSVTVGLGISGAAACLAAILLVRSRHEG